MFVFASVDMHAVDHDADYDLNNESKNVLRIWDLVAIVFACESSKKVGGCVLIQASLRILCPDTST